MKEDHTCGKGSPERVSDLSQATQQVCALWRFKSLSVRFQGCAEAPTCESQGLLLVTTLEHGEGLQWCVLEEASVSKNLQVPCPPCAPSIGKPARSLRVRNAYFMKSNRHQDFIHLVSFKL